MNRHKKHLNNSLYNSIQNRIDSILGPWINLIWSTIGLVLKTIFTKLFPCLTSEYNKISLRCRKEVIVEKVIPRLNKIGFSRPPFKCDYGWIPAAQGYIYDVTRKLDDKLQFLQFRTFRNRTRIEIHMYICKISPQIDSFEELRIKNHTCEFYQFDFVALACERWRIIYPFKLKFRWKNLKYLEWKKNRLAKKIIKYLSSDKPIKYWNKYRYTETLDWDGNVVEPTPPEILKKYERRHDRKFERWIN